MEVVNSGFKFQKNIRVNDGLASINQGDTGKAIIKERLSDNMAKIFLKGHELHVQFDGSIPTQDRVFIEVTQRNANGHIMVKSIGNQTSLSSDPSKTVDDLLKKAGFDPAIHPDLKTAVKQILSKGGSVSKESLANIQDFLKNEPGSVTEKLETLKIMQQKNIEFTKIQLHSVNTALHGKPLTESMEDLLGETLEMTEKHVSKVTSSLEEASILKRVLSQISNVSERSRAVENVLSLLDPSMDQQVIVDIKKALQIQQAAKERIIQVLPDSDLKNAILNETDLESIINLLQSKEISADLKDKITLSIQEALKLEQIGAARLQAVVLGVFTDRDVSKSLIPSTIQQVARTIQQEPIMEHVLEAVEKVLEEHKALDTDISHLTSILKKATELTEQGKEAAARKELSNAIDKMVEDYLHLPKKDMYTTLTKAEQYLINESVQSLQLDSKNILVSNITEKLSQISIDFKKVKQEMSQNLETASNLLEGNKTSSMVPAKQFLESTISKLDNAILKGNYMLYADMMTEKKMVTASSKLAEARNLLNNGKLTEAIEIVNKVKDGLEKLVFKPADNRVKHFVSEQDLLSPKAMLEKVINPLPQHEPGSRKIYEVLKGIGLMHEVNSAIALSDNQDNPPNLKSLLIKLLDTENGQTKLPLEQALANITGQQLLNKQDPTGIQNLFLQLPIQLNKQVDNVKIFVNSQKRGEKIDWENCSLYFVLETKKLGEVGISISAVNRNLSIVIKNKDDAFSQAVGPLTNATKSRLQEIGYHVGTIQFKAFSEKAETENTEMVKSHNTKKKGFDFTV